MKIIVHYPKSDEAIRELKRKVAEVHAQAVVNYIDGLPCKLIEGKYATIYEIIRAAL